MFASYALAIGFGLAVIGLFCEVANHFGWSRRRKGWGGTIVTAGTMGVVLLIANRVNHLAMATACSCAVLALSIRVSQTVLVERKEESQQETEELVAEVQVIEEVEELVQELVAKEQVEELVAEVQEFVSEEQVEELVAEVQVIDEVEEFVAEVQEFVSEEQVEELVAEVQVIDEVEELVAEVQEFVSEEAEELVAEAQVIEETQAPVAQVSMEWLNLQIANGYEAKGNGQYEAALRAFEEAAMHCQDAELSDMLKDEIAECFFSMAMKQELHVLQAS